MPIQCQQQDELDPFLQQIPFELIYLNACMNLRQLNALLALSIDQIPSAHFAVLRRADQKVIILDYRSSRQTQHRGSVTDQQAARSHLQRVRIHFPKHKKQNTNGLFTFSLDSIELTA